MYTFFGFSPPCKNDKTTFLLLFSIPILCKQIQVSKVMTVLSLTYFKPKIITNHITPIWKHFKVYTGRRKNSRWKCKFIRDLSHIRKWKYIQAGMNLHLGGAARACPPGRRAYPAQVLSMLSPPTALGSCCFMWLLTVKAGFFLHRTREEGFLELH